MSQVQLDQVPVLYIRGTNYNVGFAIGRTYMSIIQDFLDTWDYFKDILCLAYETNEGRQIYDNSLKLCKDKFPLYVQEIQGIADGAAIPFHQIFLLHIETLIATENSEGETLEVITKGETENAAVKVEHCFNGSIGCTSILCHHEDIVLGHTEDATCEMVNNFFIVCAHVVDEAGNTLEEFSTLTYPGYLPGYTMGYNKHGVIYSVNTIYPVRTFSNRTPVHFITRSLLNAKSKDNVLEILKDYGTGIGDGFSFNVIFVKEDTSPIIYNIEIGPNQYQGNESTVDIFQVPNGCTFVHCNKYLRLNIPEQSGPSAKSSCHRHSTIQSLTSDSPATSVEDVKNVLSDQSDEKFPIYRTPPKNADDLDDAATIAVGIFDIKKKTWSIYTKPPNRSDPVVVLPMNF